MGGRSPGSLAKVTVAVVPSGLQTLVMLSAKSTPIGGDVYSSAFDFARECHHQVSRHLGGWEGGRAGGRGAG